MTPNDLNRVFEQLAPTLEQEQNGLNRLLYEERKDHPMKKLKKMTAVGIAAILMLVTCAAAVMTGIDQRLIDFLGGGQQAQELLASGAQPVDVTVEDNGASLHVTQVLMDRYTILILADFTAPEGTVLDMDEEQEGIRRGFGDLDWSMPFLLDQNGEEIDFNQSWSFLTSVLDDGDPLDNHLTLVFRMDLDSGIQPDWDIKELLLPARDLMRFDREARERVTVYSGDWSCRFPVTWQNIGQSISLNQTVGQLDGVNIMLTDVYLSPMSLHVQLKRETPVSPQERMRDKGIDARWVSVIYDDLVTLTNKDGHTVPLAPLGGEASDQEQNCSFQLNEITDLAQLQTLTLRIGDGSIDIPLEDLIAAR